jgi:hypothetical protein
MMKKTGKITKLRLEIEQKNDFTLLGLVSSEPDYRLTLALNKALALSLKNSRPVICPDESGEEQTFSRFIDKSGDHDLVISLISNRSGSNYLLRKLRNIDFILHINDPETTLDKDKLCSTLREMPAITAVFNITLSTVKDKNISLIFD